MKILILNWRSVNDPLAGGAEVATFEHAKRWVKNHGAEVFWLSPPYKKGPKLKEEDIDGVKFIYRGFPLTRNLFQLLFAFPLFYALIPLTYFLKFRNKVDVVIDQVHGIPYLTPWYVKEKVVVFICEVAGDIWNKMYPFPINKAGRFVEKLVFKPYIRKKTTFVAISQSTKRDVQSLGVSEDLIKVVECGVSLAPLAKGPEKEKNYTLLFLNRLVKMKGIERALEVFSLVKKEIPGVKMWVVGRGEEDYQRYLLGLCGKLDVRGGVTFWGFVPEKKKIELLRRAHVLINTSYKEGWGLVNIEANTQGTPVVGFDVAGVGESIENGASGYVVPDGDLVGMKERLVLMYNDVALRESALEFSRRFDWGVSSSRFLGILKNV